MDILFNIIKLFVIAYSLSLPFAIINGLIFHGKSVPILQLKRLIFTLLVAIFCSLIISHITLCVKESFNHGFWIYALGLGASIPSYMRNLYKDCNEVDHSYDGFGIFASILTFILVAVFWESFFSVPHKSGFVSDISLFIRQIFW